MPATILDAVVPTRGSEDIMAAIESLEVAAGNFVLDSVLPTELRGMAWACVEQITESECVVEVKGLEECIYYKVGYTRAEDGSFSFGEPAKVEEVTSYVPVDEPKVDEVPVEAVDPEVATPPEAMARAILCESLPVHAPPAEGLTPGRPIQLLRLGKLYDLDSGNFVLDVTESLCEGIAKSASVAGFAIPIDHGHSLFKAQAADTDHSGIELYGRIVALEYRPGSGLWATPEWTASGLALLAANPGMLYVSPTLMGLPHNPTTGEPMEGRSLHSASITPTPRQDSMAVLALSKEPPMPVAELITLAKADHASLLERVTNSEKLVTELTATIKTKNEEFVALTAKLEAYESEKKLKDFADLIAAHDAAGVVISEGLKTTLGSLPIEQAAMILTQITPTRPVTPIGTSIVVEPKEPKSEIETTKEAHRIMELARKDGKSVTFLEAVRLAKGAE